MDTMGTGGANTGAAAVRCPRYCLESRTESTCRGKAMGWMTEGTYQGLEGNAEGLQWLDGT